MDKLDQAISQDVCDATLIEGQDKQVVLPDKQPEGAMSSGEDIFDQHVSQPEQEALAQYEGGAEDGPAQPRPEGAQQVDGGTAALGRPRGTAGFPMRSSLGPDRASGDGQASEGANDSFSVQNLRSIPAEEQEDDLLSQRDRLQLSNAFINQQVQASNYSGGPVAADAAAAPQGAQPQPQNVMNRFHWTQAMPFLYTLLLLFMACLSGFFSISGLVFFFLFVVHCFAYYAFRSSDDPIDMLSENRKYNKSTLLREIFKWAFLAAAVAYLLIQIVGRAAKEYEELKGMLQDVDHEAAMKDEYYLDRLLYHIISDFYSWWNLFRAVLVLAAAVVLFKIQQEEEQEAQLVSQACLNAHSDIHYSKQLQNAAQPLPLPRSDGTVIQNVHALSEGQNEIVLTLGANDNQISSSNNNGPAVDAPQGAQENQQNINTLLIFKPYQVQKCVLIFKDYKMKAEIFLVLQIAMLVLIANAQYCIYGVPYLCLALIQLANICFSHSRTDQNVRVLSEYLTIFLLVYLPGDLLAHYYVRKEQDSLKVDDEINQKYGQPRQNYQVEAYQGIMATVPSIVTFIFKIVLLLIECLKYKYSYDMAEAYDDLKNTYRNAKNEEFPQSMRGPAKPGQIGEFGASQIQGPNFQSITNKQHEKKEEDPEQKMEKDTNKERDGTNLNRFNQQGSKDFLRRQRYNKLLKLQYIKIFRKSQSFVHRILQPISLFMLSLFQMVFILQHPSVIFIILLALVMIGFFISLDDVAAWRSYTTRGKIIFGIELVYVVVQYILNIYRFDGVSEVQRKEELTIVAGVGSEQQLGYYEDDVSIFDSLFPFNQSIVFLFVIAIFTRYMSKTRIQRRPQRGSGMQEEEDGHFTARKSQGSRSQYSATGQRRGPTGRLTDNSSEVRGAGYAASPESDDGILTVYDNDTLSFQDFSDVRSQISRRSSNIGGTRRGRANADHDNQSQNNADLYQFIIQEEEDENDLDEENELDMQTLRNQSDRKSLHSSSENENRAVPQAAIFNNSNQNGTLQAPFYLRNVPRVSQTSMQGFELRNKLGQRRQREKRQRPDPTKDSTFRGKTRQWFHKGYMSMLNFFDRVVDISIVHINKLVLLALFLVSVSRPTIINAVLFIMFLVLIMVPLHHEKGYLKLTIFVNSLAICIIYTLDVFIQRDYSAIRTWVLYIIGVQYRTENVQSHVIKLKFLPYVILQVILVLSIYVYESVKYKQFKSQYMDIETQKQMMIVKQLNKRHQALSENGTRSISRNSDSRVNLRLPPAIGQISVGPAPRSQESDLNRSNTQQQPMDESRGMEDRDASVNNSSFQREGGDQEEQAPKMEEKEDPANDEDMDKKSLLAENDKDKGMDQQEEDQLMAKEEEENEQQEGEDDVMGQVHIDDKMTLPDEAKANLRKQQEMIVMYDPLTKFFIKNAAYFLIVFIFIEVVLLPLSIMNILLLILMTIIVVKMLYNETRLQTYRSLSITLQVLNIFVIIYIFTKYLFLFTEYTKNIQLKNSIENGYHQQNTVNDDGSIKHSDRTQEQQKTEDAKNQLHHSHDHDNENQSRQIQNKILQKMFGFQTTEDQKNEGGSLLSFKLLNLAIVLSLTNLLLNILRHRNLPFLLGEKERVVKREFMQSNNYESQNGSNMGQDQSSEHSQYMFTLEADEKEEMVAKEKIQMNKKIRSYKQQWACWHYTKIYIGFLLQFLLPITIILLTFIVYPLSTISVPSVIMVLIILILLATNASPDCWRTIYRSIGSLVQIMICVCYALYFALIDQMSSYDQNDQTERQQFQNMKVLWGVYQSKQVYESQQTGQADDIASVLIAIIPLFIILCTCFLQKELDKWFAHNFGVTVQVTDEVHLEVRKYWRRQRELQKQTTKEDQERVKREFTQGQEESQQAQTLGSQNVKKEDKRKGTLEAIPEQPNEALSGGTLGAEKSDRQEQEEQTPALSGAPQMSEKDSENEEDKPAVINKEGKLFEAVLESLKATDEETIAYHRGDGKVTKDVTNVFLKQMIENYIEERQRVEAMQDKNEENEQDELLNKKANSVATSGMYLNSEQDAILKDSQKQEEIELLNEKKEYLEEFIVDVLEYEAPYRHCFFVKNTAFLEYIAHRNCVNLMIYFGVYSILNKMNLLGLIQWICLYLILKKNFKPNIFKEEENEEDSTSYTAEYNRKAKYESSKNAKIVFYVKLQLVLISFLIIVQLAFSIYTNVQFSQQEDFQRNISNSFCAGPSQTYDEEEYDDEGNIYQSASPLASQNSFNKECAQDWSYYLLSMTAASQSDEESQRNIQENQDFVNTSVVIDIFFLITTYLLLFVAKGTLKLSKQQKQNHPHINDECDFVNYQESKSSQKVSNAIHRFFQSAIFVYFPYFIIVMLMYVSATFNGHAISDLLSSIYLWFALKFIINIKKLFTKNSKILRPLRIYNRIVLTLILVYQMPLFLCPSAVDIQGYTDPDYITTEDCALIMHHQTTNPSKKQYEAKQPMQLYIILMHSIGLLKENQINMTFLFLFFLTEVQQQIFQHPHFREYVVKHMIIEKESDGKVRAFMYVERFHLTRLWANRAIKEEIKILHKILLRLNDQISKSDFAKNLAGFVEYQQKSIKSEADSDSHKHLGDDESKALLNNEEDKEQDDKNDEKTDKEIKSSEQAAPDSSKELAAYIELNSHIIDSIALANLRPDKPVIPLKIIVQELKFLLEREIQSGKLERIEKLDEQLLTQYVNQLTKSLESYVYTENRIDLYHKEGIGLAIALDEREQDPEKHSNLYLDQYKDDGLSKTSKTKSAEQYLKSLSQQTINRQNLFKRLYKSYTDSVNHEHQRKEEKRQQSESETKSISTDKAQRAIEEYKSSVDLDHRNMQTSLKLKEVPSSEPSSSSSSSSQAKSSVMSSFEQDFNPSPQSYEIGEDSEEEAMQDMTWSQKLNYQIRLFLWNNYVDHLLLIHLRKKENDSFRLKRPKLQDYGIFRLTEASILSRSTPIVIIFIVFNFIMNANAISLFVVLANLCYQVLENPLVSTKFWKFMMTYMLTVISLKFIYQLPIFCGTPVYTFYSDKCNNEDITSKELASRVDYIIGIHKFAGPASYPKNVGIFYGIFSDILLLMALLLHKQYLSKIGAWNYVKTEDNIYKNPSFKLDERDISNYGLDVRDQHEQLDLLANQHHQIFIYEQSAWYEKGWYAIKKFFYSISNFYGKVLPQYMHRRQKNLDSRKRQWQPYKTHQLQKVKPGQDYFTQIFLVLLIIQIYTLIYWRNISGEDKQQSFTAASVALDRFSTVQVVTLFLILLLLLFERMLYRARYHDERDNYGKYQSQPMVQKKPVAGPESTSNQISSRARAKKTAAMRHTLTIKLLVYYSLICLIHGYIGFYVPLYQLAPLSHNPWLVIYYIFWCFYFYYSAKQIKYGYPMAPYKQTFSEDTSFLTFFAWRLYKAIPFIWEMKVIIDWTVTSTCLDLFQWFKLDDAYNTLYYNKEQSDDRKSRPEYQQRASWEKVFKGFCFAIGIIIIILAPIFLFSGINPIMMTNPVKAGLLTIDLELISTGNSYRIFETHASSINPLTKIDDASWRLYFEPQSNQIDYSDMQKLQFNTYSETQWTISPPSLKKFINDFKSISKDKTKEMEIVNFKAQWTFTRGQPMGKEKTEGQKIVALSKKDFLPVIEMLERDNQIQLPQLGIVQPVSQKNQMKLAQLDQYSVDDEEDPNQPKHVHHDGDDAGDEEQVLLQTEDDVHEELGDERQQYDDPDQEENASLPYTLLAQQSVDNQLLEDQGLKSRQHQSLDPSQLGEAQPPAGPFAYQYNPYMYYPPPQQSQQFGDQQDQSTLSPFGPEQQVQQPIYFNAQPPEYAPMPQGFEEQTNSPATQAYGAFPEQVAVASSASAQPAYPLEGAAGTQSPPSPSPSPRRSANVTLVGGLNRLEAPPRSVSQAAEHQPGDDALNQTKRRPSEEWNPEFKTNATKSASTAPKASNEPRNSTKSVLPAKKEKLRAAPAKVELSPKKDTKLKQHEVDKAKLQAVRALMATKVEAHEAKSLGPTESIQREVSHDIKEISKKLKEAVDRKSEQLEKRRHTKSGKASHPIKVAPEQHREPEDELKKQDRKAAQSEPVHSRTEPEPESMPTMPRSSARIQNATDAAAPSTSRNASASKPQRRIWVEGPAAPNRTRSAPKVDHQSQPVQKEPQPTAVEGNRSSSDDYEYREVEEVNQQRQAGPKPSTYRMYRNGKALIAVKDAFPKLLHLSGKADTADLPVSELQSNTSKYSSMELVLNRQGNQIYYWTFSLGSSDGRGGKNTSAYFRDTPGVFNSRNAQEEIEAENRAERRKQSTSKVDKKLREREKAEMQKKKVYDDQSLVILLYNEQVIGSFFGNALQLSVIGLYATIVITIGRFIRIIFDRISQRVMYEELPNTKQLFEICGGIFIAQQEGDLVREKQLYDLLILMYRSPEALIKITGTRQQHKEEDESTVMDSTESTSKGSSFSETQKKAQ